MGHAQDQGEQQGAGSADTGSRCHGGLSL
jgi:hypothetical protein